MKKNRLIPFRLMPGSWGLKGKIYEEAKAAYYYDGDDLEKQLLSIRYSDNPIELQKETLKIEYKNNPEELERKLLALEYMHDSKKLNEELNKLDVKYHHKTQYEVDIENVKNEYAENSNEYELAILEIKYRYKTINENTYKKEKSNISGEPWIGIINSGLDESQGVNGVYFEFDWNTHFIEYLKLNGYIGNSDEEIVEKWFQDVCKTNATNMNNQSAKDKIEAYLVPRDRI